MKIRLAILDTDNSCLDRITAAFTARFADRLEVCSFTNEETVLNHLNTSRIDVLLAGEEFEIDRKRIPARCSFAYFVESADVKLIRGEKAISKFQRADLLKF